MHDGRSGVSMVTAWSPLSEQIRAIPTGSRLGEALRLITVLSRMSIAPGLSYTTVLGRRPNNMGTSCVFFARGDRGGGGGHKSKVSVAYRYQLYACNHGPRSLL